MEQPATDSNTGSLDVNQAGSMFASLLSEPQATDAPAKPAKAQANAQPEGNDAPANDQPLSEEEALDRAAREEAEGTPEPEGEAKPEEALKVTIKVDGKAVELTPDEIAEAYKSGLRQADYTRKTTKAAEEVRAAQAKAAQADAEAHAARKDRETYARNLQTIATQIQGVMQEQGAPDPQLAVTNPTEYVAQKALFDQRQAHLQRVQFEQYRVAQQHQAENARLQEQQKQDAARSMDEYMTQQRDALLAKLPDWKDKAKAETEKTAISKYLEAEGYTAEEISSATDHRAVLLARKAMLYDKVMARAKAATKTVEKVPVRAERPGTPISPTDGRTSAMKQLERTGRVEDAAALFSQMLR